MNKAEVASIVVRVAASVGLAWFTVKLLAKYLDPNYASKEENKKRVAKLFEEIGLPETAELDEHELRICLNMVSGDQTGVDWDEIGGYEEIVAELKDRIILPLRIANEYKNPLLCPPRGVLLYGPPGCGKTLLAKAVAKAAECRFINLQVSNLTDKWYGESQKLAAAVFSVARKFQPVIIFIDEIDTFLRDRQSSDHEATSMMKAQFMTLWDGFSSSHQNDQIIIMGATNRPNDVDSAILRRLPARFHVDKPNRDQREKIFQVTLRDEPSEDIDFSEVARLTNELTGSDIKEVCRIAVLSRAKATLASGGSLDHRELLRTEDLISAVQKYTGKEEQALD